MWKKYLVTLLTFQLFWIGAEGWKFWSFNYRQFTNIKRFSFKPMSQSSALIIAAEWHKQVTLSISSLKVFWIPWLTTVEQNPECKDLYLHNSHKFLVIETSGSWLCIQKPQQNLSWASWIITVTHDEQQGPSVWWDVYRQFLNCLQNMTCSVILLLCFGTM